MLCYKSYLADHSILLCQDCRVSLENCVDERSNLVLELGSLGIPIHSFYRYIGVVRDLVLRCKVSEEWLALKLIYELIENDRRLPQLLEGVSEVSSVPVSLWSRWNCKYDIPGYIADMLSCHFGISRVYLSPIRSHCFRKRSLIPNQKKMKSDSMIRLESNGRLDPSVVEGCLLVDDIVTTGMTLSKVISGCDNIKCTKVLTFASANQEDSSDDGYS